MKIALDCDGPLYEWDKTARYMLREYRGCTGLEQPSREWFDHSQSWHNVTKEDWEWLWTEGVALGLFRYGHMTTGARIGVQGLARAGHKLVIVTSRPANAVNDTMEWLGLYFKDVPLSGLHILSNGEPKSSVEADVLIDDSAKNIEEWPRRGLLFDRPWNRRNPEMNDGWFPWWDGSKMRRVTGWKGVEDALKN